MLNPKGACLLVDESLRRAVGREAASWTVRRRDVGLEADVLGRHVGVRALLRLVAEVLHTQWRYIARFACTENIPELMPRPTSLGSPGRAVCRNKRHVTVSAWLKGAWLVAEVLRTNEQLFGPAPNVFQDLGQDAAVSAVWNTMATRHQQLILVRQSSGDRP